MYKKTLALISILFLVSFVSALEFPLSNYGFNEIEVTGASMRECQSFTLDLTQLKDTAFYSEGILSLKTDFIGEKGDNSFISVKINSEKEQVLWPEYFSCNNGCWARLFIDDLLDDTKLVRVCISTGGKTSSAKVNASSTIGLYDTPTLEIKNTSPSEIVLGQRAEMNIIVKNTGTKDADVFVQFIAQDLRSLLKITSFDIVEGDASATEIIPAGEEKRFTYYIKPTQASVYNLPAAALFFDNIFGETQQITSTHPQLSVIAPKQIDLVLVSEGLIDNQMTTKVVVRNNWDTPFDGNLSIKPYDLLTGNIIKVFLDKKQEKEFIFKTKTLLPGKYSLLAEIDANDTIYVSDSVSFQIQSKDMTIEIVIAVIAIIIALAIFFRIYFGK
ncbi:MAG: hypothetical protein HOE11_03695 [Candidatus Diapherotrites archaeon]|nr:hypothetical protein [Candidatus Diapherotrites archaeon]